MTVKEYNIVARNVSGKLFTYLKKCTGDAELADDLVQDSYERLWKNHKNLKVEQAEKWLFTTGYNAMLNWMRKNKRVERMDEVNAEPMAANDNYETREWLNKALAHLTDEQKRIILLRDMQGYTYKEIEEITAMNESQVKVYLFRARKRMKEILSHLAIML